MAPKLTPATTRRLYLSLGVLLIAVGIVQCAIQILGSINDVMDGKKILLIISAALQMGVGAGFVAVSVRLSGASKSVPDARGDGSRDNGA